MIMAELHLGLSMNMGIQYIYIYIYIRLLKVNIKVERILHQVHLKLKFHYLLVELNPTSYGSENRTPPEQFWGELATQLVLAAAPSCRAARSRRAPHLHSVRTAPSREQLSAAMREQLTAPRAARRNPGTHSLDSCMPMTFLSVVVGDLGTPGRGHMHNASFVPTHC